MYRMEKVFLFRITSETDFHVHNNYKMILCLNLKLCPTQKKKSIELTPITELVSNKHNNINVRK